jgi:hypothetical protein
MEFLRLWNTKYVTKLTLEELNAILNARDIHLMNKKKTFNELWKQGTQNSKQMKLELWPKLHGEFWMIKAI